MSLAPAPMLRILFADDNLDHLELFRSALRSLSGPVDVIPATSGREALEIVERDPVDLIVLDYRLPDRSGIELLAELTGPGRPPVVMITGAGDEKIAVAAMKAGAYDYVVKDDLLGDELPRAVVSALERATLARQRYEETTRLAELAFTDSLTGLRNRRFFNETFEREFAAARRYGRPLTLAIADFDHFKAANDGFGHPFGDRVLCESARALQSLVRASDLLSRYGGEEFVVLLPDTEPEGALILAERMRKVVAEIPFRTSDGQPWQVTISIGLASLSPDSDYDGPSDLLSAADSALYRAKEKGRNRVEVAGSAG